MEFRARVGLVFVLLGCFLGGMIMLDMAGDTLFPQGSMVVTPGTFIDQVFSKAAFSYGPQSWRPGYDPLGIDPGQDVLANETWYLMFIDLNTTPVSGNPNVKKVGSVRVTYNITGLAGRAVFHTYGLTTAGVPTRTNRQTGYNPCGFLVTGNATTASSMPAATPLTFPSSRRFTIALANNQLEDSYDLAPTTRSLWFNAPGSGQGALHITPTLQKPRGTVTETVDLNGSFYITATGNDPGNDLLLLVAVDRPQPDTFSLRVRSEFVRAN